MAIDLRWRSVSFYNDISLFPIVGSINILYVDRAAMLIYIWNGSSYEATEGGSGGSSITVVANYAALPDPTTVTASFYWCSASQGTAWLPGSLGGSYYNSGLYYSNGTSWEYMSSPYQARQSEVDAGVISDKFVTPNTLYNSSKWGTKQNQITLTTTGSGAATFIADTLNIPIASGGTPAGITGQIQFNNAGAFGADSSLFWDNTLKRLTLKAVGTAATDIAFRVRNSADTRDIVNIRGNKTIELLADAPATNGGLSITASAYNAPILNFYNNFTTNTLRIDSENLLVGVAGSGNFRIGTLSGDGYMGMVTPTTNNRFLKLVGTFGTEFLSIGGNSYDGAGGISLTLKTTTTNNSNFVTFSRSNNTNPFVITDQAYTGIGTNAPAARLDVRAQGALSTDIALRVRNSADTADMFSVNGNGVLYKPHASANNEVAQDVFVSQMADGRNKIRLFTKGSYNVSNAIGISFQSDTAGASISSYTLAGASILNNYSYKDNLSLSIFHVGGSNITQYSYLQLKDFSNSTTNIYISRTGTIVLNPDNVNGQIRGLALFGGTLGVTADRVVAIGSGTAPTTSTADNFQLYSNDIVAGNAAPHFRTENGGIIKLYQETTAIAAATLVSNLGTILTDTDTFDGYTLKQIVKALRNQGLLT